MIQQEKPDRKFVLLLMFRVTEMCMCRWFINKIPKEWQTCPPFFSHNAALSICSNDLAKNCLYSCKFVFFSAERGNEYRWLSIIKPAYLTAANLSSSPHTPRHWAHVQGDHQQKNPTAVLVLTLHGTEHMRRWFSKEILPNSGKFIVSIWQSVTAQAEMI